MSNNFYNLDKLDRKILQELDIDARQSFSKIAKKLLVPQETIRYRVKFLEQNNVIQNYYCIIDLGKLGYNVHKVLFKLHNVDEEQVQKIIAYILQNPNVNWLARFDGFYDVCFTVCFKTNLELSDFIDDIKQKFKDYLSKFIYSVNIQADFLNRDFLLKEKRKIKRISAYSAPKISEHIDNLDLNILKSISLNPRTTATELAEKIKVSPETIRSRILNLEKKEIINGYRVVLNNSLIGEVNYYVLIFLNYTSMAKIEKFVQFCKAHTAVNYIIKSLGEWDYELSVEVNHPLEYRKLMMEITKEYSDIVKDYQGFLVSQIHKYRILPFEPEKI